MTKLLKDKEHPYIGTRVGQYEVVELLGGGAMGLVFRAHQESVNRDVAIKFLSYDLKSSELSQRRLAREALAMGKLKHPGLVSTYEFGISDFGQPYIVMEYVEGEPLSEALKKESELNESKALHYFIQIADAMDYAHRHGVVHRDLKPANIMVTQEPWQDFLKIFDFGIARLTADSQMLTCPGEVLGSPVYMSPEQCKGEEVDHKSDIYTLGVIMYFCLTGNFPVIGTDGRTTMLLKTRNRARAFAETAPDLKISVELESLIMSMLELRKELRPDSMARIKESLGAMAEANHINVPTSQSSSLKNLVLPGSNTTRSQDRAVNMMITCLAAIVLTLALSTIKTRSAHGASDKALVALGKETSSQIARTKEIKLEPEKANQASLPIKTASSNSSSVDPLNSALQKVAMMSPEEKRAIEKELLSRLNENKPQQSLRQEIKEEAKNSHSNSIEFRTDTRTYKKLPRSRPARVRPDRRYFKERQAFNAVRGIRGVRNHSNISRDIPKHYGNTPYNQLHYY